MPKGQKAWNKGTGKGWTDARGYRLICINGKTVREHRYLMEQHLGRKLRPDELVHYINGNSTDNRIENLEVQTFDIHAALHHNGSKRLGRTKHHIEVLANYRWENERLRELNNELLEASKRLIRWVGKGIADGSFNECVLPNAAVADMNFAQSVITKATKP